jgi:alpha-D-ribose 1-methylphosphonate 5-triphosphate synthase subunit PhnG
MVVEKSLEDTLLRQRHTRAVQSVQGIVGRGKQCNVLGATQCRCNVRLARQQGDECGQVLIAGEDRGEVSGGSIFLSSSSDYCSRSEEGLSELHDDDALRYRLSGLQVVRKR